MAEVTFRVLQEAPSMIRIQINLSAFADIQNSFYHLTRYGRIGYPVSFRNFKRNFKYLPTKRIVLKFKRNYC